MNDSQLCSLWLTLNEPYSASSNTGSSPPNSIDYIQSASVTEHILLTAPHAVRHDRNGSVKKADLQTGGLCALLGQMTGSSVLIASGYVEHWESWAERSDAFTDELTNAVRNGAIVLDFHGLRDTYGIDLCIGLGSSPSAKAVAIAHHIQAALKQFNVSINEPFAASKLYTITSYVQSIGGECVQLEIAAHVRDPLQNTKESATFVRALSEVIQQIATMR